MSSMESALSSPLENLNLVELLMISLNLKSLAYFVEENVCYAACVNGFKRLSTFPESVEVIQTMVLKCAKRHARPGMPILPATRDNYAEIRDAFNKNIRHGMMPETFDDMLCNGVRTWLDNPLLEPLTFMDMFPYGTGYYFLPRQQAHMNFHEYFARLLNVVGHSQPWCIYSRYTAWGKLMLEGLPLYLRRHPEDRRVIPLCHKTCAKCAEKSNSQCSKCKIAFYCSVEHQREDWKMHKVECARWESGKVL